MCSAYNILEFLRRHQVLLVDDDLVGEGDLLDRLVDGILSFHLSEVLHDVLGINQAHDSVQLEVHVDNRALEKRERHWRRVSQPSGLQ